MTIPYLIGRKNAATSHIDIQSVRRGSSRTIFGRKRNLKSCHCTYTWFFGFCPLNNGSGFTRVRPYKINIAFNDRPCIFNRISICIVGRSISSNGNTDRRTNTNMHNYSHFQNILHYQHQQISHFLHSPMEGNLLDDPKHQV